jgi:hypothetical protein
MSAPTHSSLADSLRTTIAARIAPSDRVAEPPLDIFKRRRLLVKLGRHVRAQAPGVLGLVPVKRVLAHPKLNPRGACLSSHHPLSKREVATLEFASFLYLCEPFHRSELPPQFIVC